MKRKRYVGVTVNPLYAGRRKPEPATSERGIHTRGPKRHNPDVLDAACWCRADIVPVPVGEIRNGLTRSCGTPACDTHDINHRRGNP